MKQERKLKISEVRSEFKAEEESSPTAMKGISIKTPKELNSIVSAKQLKQMGSVTIKMIKVEEAPNQKVTSALKAQLHKFSTIVNTNRKTTEVSKAGKSISASAFEPDETQEVVVVRRPSRQIFVAQAKKPVPGAVPSVRSQEKHIRAITRQNIEMRSVLMNCKTEICQMQLKLTRLTDLIYSVLKVNQPSPEVIQDQKNQISALNQLMTHPRILKRPAENTVENSESPPAKKPNSDERLVWFPLFPIKSVTTLQRLDHDLSNCEFLELMVKRAKSAQGKVKVENVASILSNVLSTIIHPQLLSHFSVERDLEMSSFSNFRLFYARVVNAMSYETLGRIMDFRPIENFLFSRIIAQKASLKKAQKMISLSEGQPKPAQAKTVIFFRNGKRQTIDNVVNANQISWHENETRSNQPEPPQTSRAKLSLAAFRQLDENSNDGDKTNGDANYETSSVETEADEDVLESICEEQEFQFSENVE